MPTAMRRRGKPKNQMATIHLLYSGKPCCRPDFPDNVFVFRRIDTELPADVVQKMQSLPEEVKKAVEGRRLKFGTQYEQITVGFEHAKIAPYSPTAEDVEATDWELYGEE